MIGRTCSSSLTSTSKRAGSVLAQRLHSSAIRSLGVHTSLLSSPLSSPNANYTTAGVSSCVIGDSKRKLQRPVHVTLSASHFSSAAASAESDINNTASESTEETPFVPTLERKYEFFQNVEVTSDGIAVIKFDNRTKKVNTISFRLKDEAERLWEDEVHNNSSVRAVVFSSAKKDGFIAGADIFDIQSLENKEDVVPLIESATAFFHKLKSKGVPLVCAINGPALGGGLEWALWCDYRICTDSSKTKLGLPEVKLGLLPGFGGTQNLHKLVGLQKAMDMMLTGKDIRPKQAKKMGLVDLVVAPQSLDQVAIDTARGLADGTIKKSKGKGKKSLQDRLVEDSSLGRHFMWQTIQKMVDKNTNKKYPAPYAIIDSVKYGLDHPKGDAKFKFEREAFAKLAATSESEALIGIFDGMTRMKKHSYGEVAHPINRVGVLGGGLMGSGIAQVTAEKGFEVLLKDRDDASVARGLSYMDENWSKKVKRRRMSKFQYNTNSSNVVPLTDTSPSWKKHFGKTDMIIEAVFEDLTLKRNIVAQFEEATPDHCIFATNTSAIPIAEIAKGAKRPQQIIGMHYFSPVPQMPLLEIIPHEGTSESTKAAAFEVGTKQGKTCIEVKDVPGFYVNRCLGPFLAEVTALIKDGVKLDALDNASKDFGMPVGCLTLADNVGLDVATKVATFLANADLGVRMEGGDIAIMEKMMEKGWLGKKTGNGFYTYDKKGKKKGVNPEVEAFVRQYIDEDLNLDGQEIQDRIISRIVNEAAKCLEDEIISDPVVGDIGLVFGTGFAPFHGGPFRYLDTVGVDKYVGMMEGFADKYGPQFEPCQILKDYAGAGKKFHG